MTTEREILLRAFQRQREKSRGPVAVPTGTKKKPPSKPIYGPNDPRSRAGKTAITLPPAVQKAADILSPPGTPSRKVFSVLGAMSTVDPERDVAAELQQAHPIEKVLMGLPVGAPVGSLAGTAGRGVLTQTGQAAQKAAPVARRLVTEEAGAIRLTQEGEKVLRNLKPEQKASQVKAIQESTALSAEEKAARLKIIEEGPITKPAAAEALGPAAKRLYLEDEGLVEVERGVSQRNIRIATIDGDEWQVMITQYEPAMGSAQIDVARLKLAGKRVLSGFAKEHGVSLSRQEMNEVLEFIHKVDPQIVKLYGQRGGRTVLYPMPAAKAAQATEGVLTEAQQRAISLIDAPAGSLRWRKEYNRIVGEKTPVGAKTAVSESVEQIAKEPGAAPTDAKAAAAGQGLPPSPGAAAPPAKPPVSPKIRRITQPEPGFSVIGVDAQGRKVRAVAPTLKEAQTIRANILAGKEPFAGAEVQFQQKAVANAERRMKAAIKRGDKGAEQRADVELHELYSTGGKLPPKPPKPPTTGPDGTSVPPPSFEGARDKLVKILQTSVRRSNKELEALRAAERKRRAGMVEAGFQRATAAGEPPIARIRAAQRGEFPTPELELAERLLPEEVSVLRGSIYDTLGPELRQTAANVDEALTRLATEGKLPTPSEVAWMEEIFGPEFVKALLEYRTKGAKARELALGVWNLPRALLASFDDSMVLRQGLHLLPEGAPAGRALKAHIKAITSAGAEEVIEGIRANPWFNHGRARGLDLSLPGVARGLVGREEVFMGAGIAARIPILGRGIRLSERVAEAYLNKLRMETYAAHAQELTRMGASDAAFRELAQNINILSGRASLGKAQAIAPYLNGLFFSARLNWARAQAPIRILRQVPNLGTPEGRHLAKMLAKDVYGVWAGIAGMVGVAAAAGAAVELDPRSSDFGKIQIGTVRVDPWAGQQQFAVLMARLISGEVKTTTTRTVRPQEEMNTLARFIESKFHPALGQLIAVKRGKSYVGEELTVNEYAKQWLPLFVQDIQEITSGTTPGMAAALGTAAFFGVSVYNIPGVPASVVNQLEDAVNQYTAIPADSLELAPGQMNREKFRERNPKVDAALFIAGQVTSLTSSKATQEAAMLIKEHGINADDIRGIDQRKERLEQARLAGKKLDKTEVDALIRMLEQGVAPVPRSQPTPTVAQTPASGEKRPSAFDRLRELEPVR